MSSKTIHEKLLAVQSALKVPKNQRNTFGNYNYRSCEDILEAVKKLAHAEQCIVMLTDSLMEIAGRFYIKATASFSDGTQTLSADGYAREEETKKGMDGSQITGAASSYARKYALNGLFCIDDTKDSDATNDHEKKDAAKPPAAKPVQRTSAPPAKPAKKQPTATQVMETLTPCTTDKQADLIYSQAGKYQWPEADWQTITTCYDNVKKRIADAAVSDAEREGMKAA